LVDANRTITSSSQVEVFDIYLEDNSTGTVKAAEGDTIVIDFFNGNFGTVDSFSAITDDNGHVQFTYTAPEDLVDFNNTTITFRVESTTSNSNKVESIFIVDSNIAFLSKLRLATPSLTIGQDAQSESIIVLAFNGNNEAFSGGFVTVVYPDEITSGSVSGGQFTQNSVDIVNGQAVFDFIGPDPLESSDLPLNFTFIYSENNDINTTLTVEYIPDNLSVVVDDGNVTVTLNGEVVTIDLTVYDKDNSLYDGGNIKITYPASVLSGTNVGSFSESTVEVVNGKASLIYTAANPLENNESFIFTFYHDSQPELSKVDFNLTVEIAEGQVVLTNYVLDAIYETSMNLDTTKGMTFYIENEDGVKIDDANVTSIRVTVLNAVLGSLEDTAGNTGNSLTVNNENSVQMNIKSDTLSGIIPIEVYTEFKDANNNDKNLTKVFNVVVLSGAPTAMSLSYAGTSQDSENAKFIENWVLTVTDKYNNLINTTPSISMGALIGYAESSAATVNVANYLYYDANESDGSLSNLDPDTFKSEYEAFANVDIVNDKLVLFGGEGYRFDAFGKWDIDNNDDNTTLVLSDDYNGTDISGLAYAVGHNFRNETCAGSPVVANVYAKDNDNILGSTGSMIIQVEYDYYLVGKSVVLWTNLVGEHNNTSVKIGLGQKVTLRGNGLTGESYAFAKDFEGVVRLDVTISDTVEWYRNANFGYAVEVSGSGNTFDVIGTSMDQNITSCIDGAGNDIDGVAYVDINITHAESDGEINLLNVLPSKEF